MRQTFFAVAIIGIAAAVEVQVDAPTHDKSKDIAFDENSSLDQASAYGIDFSGHKGKTASDFIDKDDEGTQPICYMGGMEDVIDTSWPVPQCCRIYADTLYRGRFQDFCEFDVAQSGNLKNMEVLAYEYGAWKEEVTSYKCGDDTGITFYFDVRGVNIMDKGGPGSSNWNMYHTDKALALRVDKYDGEDRPGTIYNTLGCNGVSHVVDLQYDYSRNIYYSESGKTYNKPSTWNAQSKSGKSDWEPKSVWLQNGYSLETFFGEDFQKDSFTIRRDKFAENVHERAGQCYNFQDLNPKPYKEAASAADGIYVRSLSYRKYIELEK